jgi:hypothetical protein
LKKEIKSIEPSDDRFDPLEYDIRKKTKNLGKLLKTSIKDSKRSVIF